MKLQLPSRGPMPAHSMDAAQTSVAEAAMKSAVALTLSSVLCFTPLAPMGVLPAIADGSTKEFKFPPVDRANKDRCQFTSSAMGQANAARDSLNDYRECKMQGASAAGFDLSGALMANGDFTGANFKETQISKAYAPNAIFDKADFSNGVVDRAYFNGGSFRGALFTNTVLSGTSFDDADLTDTDFTEAYIGMFDLRKLCKNPTLNGENPITKANTRESANCGGSF